MAPKYNLMVAAHICNPCTSIYVCYWFHIIHISLARAYRKDLIYRRPILCALSILLLILNCASKPVAPNPITSKLNTFCLTLVESGHGHRTSITLKPVASKPFTSIPILVQIQIQMICFNLESFWRRKVSERWQMGFEQQDFQTIAFL